MLPFNATALVAAASGPWQFAALIAVLLFLYLMRPGPPDKR